MSLPPSSSGAGRFAFAAPVAPAVGDAVGESFVASVAFTADVG